MLRKNERAFLWEKQRGRQRNLERALAKGWMN